MNLTLTRLGTVTPSAAEQLATVQCVRWAHDNDNDKIGSSARR